MLRVPVCRLQFFTPQHEDFFFEVRSGGYLLFCCVFHISGFLHWRVLLLGAHQVILPCNATLALFGKI